ncbi:MAG: VIT domain-containing protein [Elusimicrobiota bacterium]
MRHSVLAGIVAVAMVLCAGIGLAKMIHYETEPGRENLSPYFLVGNGSEAEQFPLLKTEANVNIAGMCTNVELVQVYKNNGSQTIEAIYVFPLSTKSAVHAMTMKIGNRIIRAQIDKTEQARQTYENAKNNGQTASLLVQKRPNVFEMNVANIMPGDTVEVIVQYTETLVPERGVYEFVFPAVVGPRYTGESDPNDLRGKDNWAVMPYLKKGSEIPYGFNITVNLKTGIPISRVWSTSHRVDVRDIGPGEAAVLLPSFAQAGDRDYILKYSLQGNKIETGLLLYPGEKKNYFLLMLEPPEKVKPAMVPPREYLFIVDVSGSMHGFPLDVSKQLITNIINGLRSEDYFNIMFFSGGSNALSNTPLSATYSNKQKALQMLNSMQGGGGTAILDALQKAMALEKKEGMSRIIVAATDGYVSVEKKTFELIRNSLGEANFFAFGIGMSVNRHLIEGMARAGNGDPFIVTSQQEAKETAEKFMEYIKSPLLTDINITCENFDGFAIEPPRPGDLFAERPILVYGKYKHADGQIIVTGRTVNGKFRKAVKVSKYLESRDNIAVKYLWARERIKQLSDFGEYGESVQEEVTQLGLEYHLMTQYTSFVAVDSEKRNTGGSITVKQPLPLPGGVSNLAVGSQVAYKSKSGGAPVMMREFECISYDASDCKKAEEKLAPVLPLPENRLRVTGGKLPEGMTLREVETVHLTAIKKELTDAFNKAGITGLTVSLKIQNGKVTDVKVLKYAGARIDCDTAALEKIFKKMQWDASYTGNIELELKML